MKTRKHFNFMAIVAIIGIAYAFTACPTDGGSIPQPKTYTVTFNADNGSPNTIQTVAEGNKADKPADPAKDGYSFDYWFNVATDTEWDFDTAVTENLTLRAKWTLIITYTVTFNADNGTENTTQTVVEGGKAAKPANPTKNGFNFVYWFNEATDVEWDFNTAVTANINLKAKWSTNQYTVTFDADNGTANTTQTVAEGGKADKPADPAKDGYSFDYWFNAATDTEWDFNTAVTATITLKAKWTLIITYTVTFNADNGTENTTQTVAEGNKADKPINPAKNGFNFVYWFNEATDLEWDFNTAITDNIDLKAKWTPDGKSKESAIPLSFDTWEEGNQNLWFYFTATASTQYIHIDCGTAPRPGFSVYDNNGTEIGEYPSYPEPSYPYGGGFGSRSVTIAQAYYINTRQIDSGLSYKIAFNDSDVPPAIALPDSGITQLTHNTWTNGELTSSNRVQWFSFIATTDTEYIHCSSLNAYIRLYDHNGVAVGNGISTAGGISFSHDVIAGQSYYIKIWSIWIDVAAYKITFNSSNAQPPITLPTENINQLSLNTWTNGEIVGEDQWYKFTATANTHYVYLNEGTMRVGFVQLYDSNGLAVGESVYTVFPDSFSRAVTIGNEYYMRVYPYDTHSSYKGTYQIAVTESNGPPAITLPTAGITQLTENTWFDGEIVSTTERQWFSFTASASIQYIHFVFNAPLSNLGIKVYDDSGVMVYGRGTGVYNTRSYLSVTNGNVYYFEVWSGYGDGTYKAAFNTTETPPAP